MSRKAEWVVRRILWWIGLALQSPAYVRWTGIVDDDDKVLQLFARFPSQASINSDATYLRILVTLLLGVLCWLVVGCIRIVSAIARPDNDTTQGGDNRSIGEQVFPTLVTLVVLLPTLGTAFNFILCLAI